MKKKLVKKLALSRETLYPMVSKADLAQVAGGTWTWSVGGLCTSTNCPQQTEDCAETEGSCLCTE